MKTHHFLGILGTLSTIILIWMGLVSNYRYSNEIKSYWNLADKSSTIQDKAVYIDKFVLALESSGLSGNSRLIFKTPDNSFDYNLKALKSLQSRLHEIQTMDVSSFEYQTAMQQITGQEQGEAYEMLSIFRSVFYLEHYPLLWCWFAWIWIILTIFLFSFAFYLWAEDY